VLQLCALGLGLSRIDQVGHNGAPLLRLYREPPALEAADCSSRAGLAAKTLGDESECRRPFITRPPSAAATLELEANRAQVEARWRPRKALTFLRGLLISLAERGDQERENWRLTLGRIVCGSGRAAVASLRVNSRLLRSRRACLRWQLEATTGNTNGATNLSSSR